MQKIIEDVINAYTGKMAFSFSVNRIETGTYDITSNKTVIITESPMDLTNNFLFTVIFIISLSIGYLQN